MKQHLRICLLDLRLFQVDFAFFLGPPAARLCIHRRCVQIHIT